MGSDVEYSSQEQFWLWLLVLFGFVAVNGAFVYGLLFQPGALAVALMNPIAAAFIVEDGCICLPVDQVESESTALVVVCDPFAARGHGLRLAGRPAVALGW